MPQTLIAILNWNNAPDTISCIESVMDLPDVHIAVMDNNSTDGSLAEIRTYLRGHGGYSELAATSLGSFDSSAHKVTIVASEVNGGFAKGNNVLLRAAMNSDMGYVWLLNNDAVAAPGALDAMLQKIKENERTAFIGSVILDGTNRELIQCCGVKYYKWFGVSKLIMKDEVWNERSKNNIPYETIDFQNGASLLIRVSALKDIGLMDERFFLYSEEHDWQYTANEKEYSNVLAADSVVYHKGSVSTNNKKHLFFYYYNKSAIILARKHNPFFVTLVSTVLQTGVMLVRTRLFPKSVYWGFKGIFEGWSISLK
jgi:hypothetical protein